MYRIIIDDDHKCLCLPTLTDDEIALCKYIIAGKLNVCLVGSDSTKIVKVCSHFLNHVKFTHMFCYENVQTIESVIKDNTNVMFIVDRTSYFGSSNCKNFTGSIREEFERTGKYNNQVIISNNSYGCYDPNDMGNFQSMINSSFMFYDSDTEYGSTHRKLTLQEYKDMKAYALYRADDPIRNSTEEFIFERGRGRYDNDVCRCAEAIHTVNHYEQHGIFPPDSKLLTKDITMARKFMVVNHPFRY